MESLAIISNDPGETIVRAGLDIGKRQDHSAIIITEEVKRFALPHYLVRSIERLPLGTAYPAVVDRIVQVMTGLQAKGSPRFGPRRFTVELILDATGVGLPIGDMVRERGLDPKLILFTGSDKVNDLPQGVVSVGKAWMVGRMQVLLQGKRLHLPTSPEATVLVKELLDYDISVSDNGHASFNAKASTHDDLVIALGLSCGIERSAGRATSRSYLYREPTQQEIFADRDRVRRRLAER